MSLSFKALHVALLSRCHKEILSLASPLLRLEVRKAEAERLRDARPLFPARQPPRRLQQKLRVSRPSLLEFKLCRWAFTFTFKSMYI